ncbi:hypothetical protein J3R30DRAFT_3410390 [Lentinula aciculospora]|uniref:Uncharacterized protein n=1 Tax=Lentinula aciculospora TaxID=153920 RepID=A0A9W8ZXK3_9AGAR|nr:hypothetical protein J3R30DRAFT_3410390 [Lentinula aciculospora]
MTIIHPRARKVPFTSNYLFPLTYHRTPNITLLVAGPIALALLAISESALARFRAGKRLQVTLPPGIVRPTEVEAEDSSVSQNATPLQAKLVKIDPPLSMRGSRCTSWLVYGNPVRPILSFFTLAILVLSLVLSPPQLGTNIEELSQAPTVIAYPSWASFRTLSHSQLRLFVAFASGVHGCFGIAETAELEADQDGGEDSSHR